MKPPNFSSAAFHRDAHAVLAQLRREAPVCKAKLTRWQSVYVVTRYADVAAAFRHPALSADRMAAYARVLPPELLAKVEPLIRNLSAWILMRDPPAQTRIRGLLSAAFTPRFVAGMRERTAKIVDELIDAVADREGFDLIESIAYPLPVRVIGDMLGLPPEDCDRLKSWSDALASFLGVARIDPAVVARAVLERDPARFRAMVDHH